MFSGMYKVAGGARSEQDRQVHIARNLASAQLPGYRREFQAALAAENGGKTRTDHRSGQVQPTGRPLDFAINGDSFFTVEDKEGNQLLTRNGRFFMSPDRRLVTSENLPVLGVGGPIQVPADIDVEQLVLDQNGALVAMTPQGILPIATLQVMTPEKVDALQRISANYYREGEADLQAGDPREIVQRSIEQSNVSPLLEMSSMIESMREFETAYKMVNMTNDILRKQTEI